MEEQPCKWLGGDRPSPWKPVANARSCRLQVGACAVHGEFAPVRVQGTRERLKVGISYLIGLDSFVSRGLSLSTRS